MADMFDLNGLNPISVQPTQTFSGVVPQSAPTGLTDDDIAWKKRHSGIGGVGHDILGYLGDFLLSRLHMGTPYQTSQKQHELNYAFDQGGNSDDPAEKLAAIDRVQHVDFAQGSKLREQFIDDQRLQAQLDSTKEAREQRLAMAQQAADTRTRGLAGAMISSMAGKKPEEQAALWTKLRPQILAAADRQNLDLRGELPEDFQPDVLDAFADQSVPVGTQRAQRLTEKRIDNQNAQAGARQDETVRHHTVQEGQGEERIGQGQQRIDNAAARTAASGARADARASNKPPRPTAADITYLRRNPAARDKFDGHFGVGMSKRILGL